MTSRFIGGNPAPASLLVQSCQVAGPVTWNLSQSAYYGAANLTMKTLGSP